MITSSGEGCAWERFGEGTEERRVGWTAAEVGGTRGVTGNGASVEELGGWGVGGGGPVASAPRGRGAAAAAAGAATATASGTELGPLGAHRSRGSIRFAILPLAGSCRRRSAF